MLLDRSSEGARDAQQGTYVDIPTFSLCSANGADPPLQERNVEPRRRQRRAGDASCRFHLAGHSGAVGGGTVGDKGS